MQLIALPDFPLVDPGDDLVVAIRAALARAELQLGEGDVLVVAQKIVSKAENRYVNLNEVVVGDKAKALAVETGKDPRLVQLVLDESVAVLRHRPGVLIVEHRNGYVHANAGIDQSNIEHQPGNPRALLLPKDSDASAARLRSGLGEHINVIINDTAGRAWQGKNRVELNPRLHECPEGEIDRTLRHELAHLIAYFRASRFGLRRRIDPHGVDIKPSAGTDRIESRGDCGAAGESLLGAAAGAFEDDIGAVAVSEIADDRNHIACLGIQGVIGAEFLRHPAGFVAHVHGDEPSRSAESRHL